MKKFVLAVCGLALTVALFFHYHQDMPKEAGKEPPLTGWHRSVVKDGPTAVARWQKAIERTLAQHRSSVPADLVVGFMLTESMGKPRAKNPSGATGLLMVKPVVCKELRIRKCNLLNPHKNLAVGVQYLRLLERKYGFKDEKLILAYGVGPERAKEILKTREPLAHQYVRRVLYARSLGKAYLANS